MKDWKPGTILMGHTEGRIEEKQGLIFAGLGLFMVCEADDDDPPCWSVTHLKTGSKVVILLAERDHAIELASEIAAITDWTFETIEGWRNTTPDLPARINAIADREPEAFASRPKAEQRLHDDRPEDQRKMRTAADIAERLSNA